MTTPKILLVGGSGFIGHHLGIHLSQAHFKLNLLTRTLKPSGMLSFPAKQFQWDIAKGVPNNALEGVSHIINLAGESIGEGRWTKEKKEKIVASRVQITREIVKAANKGGKIRTLVQASAIGFYGNTGDQKVMETHSVGAGFLAETTKKWEEELAQLQEKIRPVIVRLGVVLGHAGGALSDMLMPYQMGIGATIGPGDQFLSWIHVADVCQFIERVLGNESDRGIYNLTAPKPVTYRELHGKLQRYYSALSWAQIPPMVLKMVLGQRSELLLTGQQVMPQKLVESGYRHRFPEIDSCLENLLGKMHDGCQIFEQTQWVPASLSSVWDFFSHEENLKKVTPPELDLEVTICPETRLNSHRLIDFRIRFYGFPIKWRSKIIEFVPPTSFRDVQLTGPYKIWDHHHEFKELDGGTLIVDYVRFKPPFGIIGKFLTPIISMQVGKIFQFRRKALSEFFRE